MHRILKCLVVSLLLFAAGVAEAYAQYDKDVFFMRGRHALAEGRYAQAIENFNILSQLDTSDYYTFFFRGIAGEAVYDKGCRFVAAHQTAECA